MPMQLECRLVSNGMLGGNPTGHKGPRGAGLRPGAVAWRLLLQVDTDDDTGRCGATSAGSTAGSTSALGDCLDIAGSAGSSG